MSARLNGYTRKGVWQWERPHGGQDRPETGASKMQRIPNNPTDCPQLGLENPFRGSKLSAVRGKAPVTASPRPVENLQGSPISGIGQGAHRQAETAQRGKTGPQRTGNTPQPRKGVTTGTKKAGAASERPKTAAGSKGKAAAPGKFCGRGNTWNRSGQRGTTSPNESKRTD